MPLEIYVKCAPSLHIFFPQARQSEGKQGPWSHDIYEALNDVERDFGNVYVLIGCTSRLQELTTRSRKPTRTGLLIGTRNHIQNIQPHPPRLEPIAYSAASISGSA